MELYCIEFRSRLVLHAVRDRFLLLTALNWNCTVLLRELELYIITRELYIILSIAPRYCVMFSNNYYKFNQLLSSMQVYIYILILCNFTVVEWYKVYCGGMVQRKVENDQGSKLLLMTSKTNTLTFIMLNKSY